MKVLQRWSPASALFFTTLDKLQAFLARDGHGALRDFGSNSRDFCLLDGGPWRVHRIWNHSLIVHLEDRRLNTKTVNIADLSWQYIR